MITKNGSNIIKRVFAGQLPQIAGSMAFGTGATPETVDDTELEAEVVRVSITSIGADLDNNRIVFKASIAPGAIPTITEVGLYSSNLLVTGNTSPDGSNLLVARTVLTTPRETDPDIVNEVEYSLEINVI